MNGMNMNTGELITGIEYLRQSVWRILSTPLGTRIMRPEFGSRLPELIDYPFNSSTRLAMEAATSDALARWEPTFDVQEVEVKMDTEGVVLITLVGEFFGQPTRVEDIQIGRQGTVDETVIGPVIPTDPSIPQIPITPAPGTGDPNYDTFLFGNDNNFLFGNDLQFGWD